MLHQSNYHAPLEETQPQANGAGTALTVHENLSTVKKRQSSADMGI